MQLPRGSRCTAISASSGVSGGSGGDASGGATTTGGDDCKQVACLRPYECATSCDVEPVYVGCCPCQGQLIDQFTECSDTCEDGDMRAVDCNTCTCSNGL